MKKSFLSFVILLFIGINHTQSQYPLEVCEMNSYNSPSTVEDFTIAHNDALDFFKSQNDCMLTDLKVNHILLYNDQGQGNFDLNDSEESAFFFDIVNNIEKYMEELKINSHCPESEGFVLKTGLEISYKIHQVSNEFLWNVENYSNTYRNEMDQLIDQLGTSDELNMYWPIDGTFYYDWIENGEYLSTDCDNLENPSSGQLDFSTGNFGFYPSLNLNASLPEARTDNKWLGYLHRKNRSDCANFPVSSEVLLTWFKNGMKAGLPHEFFHNMDLTHAIFECDNNMMLGSDHPDIPQTNRSEILHEDQIARVNRALSIRNVKNTIDHEINVGCYYTWDSPGNTLIIDRDVSINRNIRIASGSEIEINEDGLLCMANDGKIIVERGAKLIVDGGMITSCGENKWRGILVEGAPRLNGQIDDPYGPTDATYAGTVIMTNGGTIDNAVNGISTKNKQYPWSEQKAYFGGLIYCDNANFTNCNRAVEFMPFGNAKNLDKSSFNETNFIDIANDGVTNWASDGVTFTKCHFENIGGSGAGGYNAAINVIDGNKFVNVTYGLLFTGTKMNELSPRIGMLGTDPNEFLSGSIGIAMTSVNNLEQVQIENNNFSTTNGLWSDGVSWFSCEKNNFTDVINGVIAGATANSNRIRNNEFLNNHTALALLWENNYLTFLNNCMDGSTDEDVWIYGDLSNNAVINSEQGNNILGAGNCFSKNMTPELFTDGQTQSFTYFTETGMPSPDCHDPEATGNFVLEQSGSVADPNCGSEGGSPQPESPECNPSETTSVLLSEIQTLDSEIAYLKSNNGSLSLINSKERCLNLSLRTLAGIYANSDDYNTSNQFFAGRPEFQMRLIPISNKIQNEEFISARSYLNSLITQNTHEINYKTAMHIYLDYLETEDYTLDDSDKYFLESNGVDPSPLSGYLRSVYFEITGERLELNLPSRSRSQNTSEEDFRKSLISVFPNPLNSEVLNITGIEKGTSMKIFDAMGRTVLSIEYLSESQSVPVSNLKGIYFLQLSKHNDIVYEDKLIIL